MQRNHYVAYHKPASKPEQMQTRNAILVSKRSNREYLNFLEITV